MKNIFKGLEPKSVWTIFEEILEVPRPSKKEERVREYLRGFAERNTLQLAEDKAGNIVISRSAAAGLENIPAVVLQVHMDMVCEKNADVVHDFERDPINAYFDADGWVKARGTTLGADCGIGMAMAMAVLVEPNLHAPRVEALFTVDEEQGLTGAMKLGDNMLTGKWLINLDSEDEGEIFVGCAGGVDTLAERELDLEPISAGYTIYNVAVGGLQGGHSGDDIHRDLANANKVICRLLWLLCKDFGSRLINIDGGNLRNAIAREASALLAIPVDRAPQALEKFQVLVREILSEYYPSEPEAVVGITVYGENIRQVMSEKCQWEVLRALQCTQHGVKAYCHTMPGMVETSTNLASVKIRDAKIHITTSQRSSIASAKRDLALTVAETFKSCGFSVRHSDGYPGWAPNPDAQIVKCAVNSYKKIFSKQPVVRAIHAGLECGLILEKFPAMEAISIGPTLRGVHSPSERLEAATVPVVWTWLLDIINQSTKI